MLAFRQPASGPYGDRFYEWQMDGSYRSAQAFVAQLARVFRPRSVVDVGCGRGTWLKAFAENGAVSLTGLDGSWNAADQIHEGIAFRTADLEKPIPRPDERHDLALSLEVAEHLDPAAADTFVESLTGLSDVVVFGAAFCGQGGVHHVNEQQHTYWAQKFVDRDYRPFDFFRPDLWGRPEVDYWYQQNTFLYVKRGAALATTLADGGWSPIRNLAFMNAVHPTLYFAKQRPGPRTALKMLLGRG